MTTKDIYSSITDKIIADLERGELTWRKPWSDANLGGNVMLPLRSNDVPYSGINTIMLWSAAVEKGFTSPYWMTFKQAQTMKANVKKGEKGSIVVYADKIQKEETKEDGTSEVQMVPFMKQYVVFNASQIEGLPDAFYKLPERTIDNPEQRLGQIDNFFAMTKANLKLGSKAAYYITSDHIEMPPFECFNDAYSYYSVLAHETTHWTRHPSRLNRDFNRKKWGDEGYAKEELVAELGSCFLAANLGLSPIPREDHSAYIQNWLQVLKNDKKFIIFAASYAQKAVEYLTSLQEPAAKVKQTFPVLQL